MGKELKFYKESPPSDQSCYPDGGAPGDGCTMTKAKAVLMYRQFLTVNDPCEFVKRSSPFQCVREEASPLTQRLSLAYANSGLLYGILCAMAVNYMYATKKVTLETVDIEQLQKLASMNKVSAEEQPAKWTNFSRRLEKEAARGVAPVLRAGHRIRERRSLSLVVFTVFMIR